MYNNSMSGEDRIKAVLNATPEQLATIDRTLKGEAAEPEKSMLSYRLLRMGEVCKAINCSRATLWRAIRDGRIKTVEIGKGLKRVPETELQRLVTVGETA